MFFIGELILKIIFEEIVVSKKIFVTQNFVEPRIEIPQKVIVLCNGQVKQKQKTRNKKPFEPVQNDRILEEYKGERVNKKTWLAPRPR